MDADVWFMKRFLTRPIACLGFGGLASAGCWAGDQAWFLLGEKLIFDADIGNRPLLSVAVLAILAGVQFCFCFGCWPRTQIAHYQRSQGRPIYRCGTPLRGRLSGQGSG